MTESHSDDHWKNLAHRDVGDDAVLEAASSLDPNSAAAAAIVFISALSRNDLKTLRQITSPESGWGDFQEARQALEDIPDWGVGSVAEPAVGREDIAYVKILANVSHSMQATDDDVVGAAAILTMVRTHHQWVAHAMGDYWRP